MAIRTVDTTNLRNNLSDALRYVRGGETLLVKKRGKLQVAVIDLDAYEDLLAASDPNNLKAIKQARKEYKRGEVLEFDEVFGDI